MLFTCRRTFTMYVCIILEHYYRITFGFKFKCAKTSLQYKVKTTNLNLVYVLCIVFSKNIVLGMRVLILQNEFSLPAVYLYCTLWSTFSFNVWYNLFTLNFLNVTNLSIATSQSSKLLKMNFVVFFMTREQFITYFDHNGVELLNMYQYNTNTYIKPVYSYQQ